MQVGNEGDAEAFEGFGDITVGEVIFHDTVYAAISGRDVHGRRRDLRSAKYQITFFLLGRSFFLRCFLLLFRRNFQVGKLRMIRSKQAVDSGIDIEHTTRQDRYNILL